jgi:hypothetical protein
MSETLMSQMSKKILLDLIKSGLTPHESMVVLAQTAAAGFFAEQLTREQSMARFKQMVDNVYDGYERVVQ